MATSEGCRTGALKYRCVTADNWAHFPANAPVSLACEPLNDVGGITFCDGSYVGPGGSFDIQSGQTIKVMTDGDDIVLDPSGGKVSVLGAGIQPVQILDVGGATGTTGQYLVKGPGNTLKWQTAASAAPGTWVGTAETPLNMAGYYITSDVELTLAPPSGLVEISPLDSTESARLQFSVIGDNAVITKEAGLGGEFRFDSGTDAPYRFFTGGIPTLTVNPDGYVTVGGGSGFPGVLSIKDIYGSTQVNITNTSGDAILSANSLQTTRFIQTTRAPYALSFYVSKTGGRIGACGSESDPFITIGAALAVTNAISTGSSLNPDLIPTIFVDSGNYNETLSITRSVTIVGRTTYLSNNVAGITDSLNGFCPVSIGSTTQPISIISTTANMVVRFENLDFRGSIYNTAVTPTQPLRLIMNYCLIRVSGVVFAPIISIAGPNATNRSQVFMSNVRSDGSVSGQPFPAYRFNFTDVYTEECRWAGVPVDIAMISSSGSFIAINSEFRYQNTASNTIPLFSWQQSGATGGAIQNNIRFTSCILSMEYNSTKASGADIISVQNVGGWSPGATPSITLDNNNFIYSNGAANSGNVVLRNNTTIPINLFLQRSNTLTSTVTTLTQPINYTNFTVQPVGGIISPTQFLNNVIQLPATLSSASFSGTTITYNCVDSSFLTQAVALTGTTNTVSTLTLTSPRAGGQYELILTNNGSGSTTINNVSNGTTVRTNYSSPVVLAADETAIMTIRYNGSIAFVSVSRYA